MSGHVTYFKSQLEPRFKKNAKSRRALEFSKLEVHRLVDIRDRRQCRACGQKCVSTMAAVPERWERHEIQPRSLGGKISITNTVGLCLSCHHDASPAGGKVLTISGNPQQRLRFEQGGEVWFS
jgi:5-methylcytosine-specific restriction endonuclease McrA